VVPERFPAYALGRAAGITGGTRPATFNAANETAVELFLAGAIRFGRIAEIIEQVLADAPLGPATSLDAVLEADRSARRRALEVAC
jgi:1-deoxy-D-xylulose-5-phosphate reductoisomerase